MFEHAFVWRRSGVYFRHAISRGKKIADNEHIFYHRCFFLNISNDTDFPCGFLNRFSRLTTGCTAGFRKIQVVLTFCCKFVAHYLCNREIFLLDQSLTVRR
jgi:hypothetical protein